MLHFCKKKEALQFIEEGELTHDSEGLIIRGKEERK